MALAAAVAPLRADDAKPVAPTIVARVKSIDGLLGDFKYLVALVGHEEEAKQVEQMLPAWLGPKGLAGTGIDSKRPFGLYGVVTPAGVDSYVVALIPAADEKAFAEFVKDMLGRFGATVDKADDTVYTVKHPAVPVEAYFTFANQYAYVTAKDKEPIAVAARRVAPAQVFLANDNALAAVTVHIDQIPDMIKQIALGQVEVQMSAAKDRKAPNETPAQAKFKAQAIDYVAQQLKSFLHDARALEYRLAIDRQADEISSDLSLTAKPASALAKQIMELGQRTSPYGGFRNLSLQVLVNLAVPQDLREPLAAVVDEGFQKSLEKEQDPAKKEVGHKVFEVLGPIVKAGRLDFFTGLRGPDAAGKYTAAAALQVPDGKAVDRLVRELVPQIPPKERALITLDAETIAGVKVHKLDLSTHLSPDGKRVFGASAEVMVAFTGNSVVAGIGSSPGAAVKALVEATSPKVAPPFALDASVARLAVLDKDKGALAAKVAAEVFGPGEFQGKDRLQFSVEGGSALRVRFSLKGEAIKFAARVQEGVRGGK
jgi:hypothetical protein